MSTVFSNVAYQLSDLISGIELGTIGLPEIQRPFVWKQSKVRDLFDSMYKGFPVGYLLFWANDVRPGAKQIGAEGKQLVPQQLIVDGQQRLTALYAVVKGRSVIGEDFVPHRIRIAFRPRDAQFDVATGPIRKDPEYIADISELWAEKVQLFGYTSSFLKQLQQYRQNKGELLDDEEAGRIAAAIGRLHGLQHYPFTALLISAALNEEQVADIFVRINSKGVPLNQADFILTLMSVHWDAGRKELEAFCRAARQSASAHPSPYNRFIQPDPDQLLRVAVALAFRRARLENVYSVLRGKDMDTGQVSEERRQAQFEALAEAQGYALNLENWKGFLRVPMVSGYRTGSLITSQTALVYAYALYLLGRRDFHVDHAELRGVMARWLFMTFLTARYSSSPESQMEKDLTRLRSVREGGEFVAVLDQIIDDALTDDYWRITLPNDLATSSARSPALFAYYAALNLLDAPVLFSALKVSELLDPSTHGQRSSLERHHLFPRRFLEKQGYSRVQEINQIANFALVEWPDNAKISARAPAEYFPEFVDKMRRNHHLDDASLARMMHLHALPEDWHMMTYETFLTQRRARIATVVREGWDMLRSRTGRAALGS
jgi:hypothetical protein